MTGTNLIKTIPWIGGFLYRVAVGGGDACSTALTRFYTWHIFALIIPAMILLVWHAFRVRRDGGIAVPSASLRIEHSRISRFDLVRREVLAMLLVGVALILLASFFPAPIEPAMTGKPIITEEARAPLFFLWVQQLLKWGDPFTFGVLIPLGILAILALIPYIFHQPAEIELGRWFPKSNRIAQIVFSLLAIIVVGLTLLAVIS